MSDNAVDASSSSSVIIDSSKLFVLKHKPSYFIRLSSQNSNVNFHGTNSKTTNSRGISIGLHGVAVNCVSGRESKESLLVTPHYFLGLTGYSEV